MSISSQIRLTRRTADLCDFRGAFHSHEFTLSVLLVGAERKANYAVSEFLPGSSRQRENTACFWNCLWTQVQERLSAKTHPENESSYEDKESS